MCLSVQRSVCTPPSKPSVARQNSDGTSLPNGYVWSDQKDVVNPMAREFLDEAVGEERSDSYFADLSPLTATSATSQPN